MKTVFYHNQTDFIVVIPVNLFTGSNDDGMLARKLAILTINAHSIAIR